MDLKAKTLVGSILLAVTLSIRSSGQDDSVQARRNSETQMTSKKEDQQAFVVPPLENRLTIFAIGVVTVGGLGLILNAKRKRLKKQSSSGQYK